VSPAALIWPMIVLAASAPAGVAHTCAFPRRSAAMQSKTLVKRNSICKYGLVWQSKVQTWQRYLQKPWSECVVAAPIVGQYIVRLE